jgi:hypothetical protein
MLNVVASKLTRFFKKLFFQSMIKYLVEEMAANIGQKLTLVDEEGDTFMNTFCFIMYTLTCSASVLDYGKHFKVLSFG